MNVVKNTLIVLATVAVVVVLVAVVAVVAVGWISIQSTSPAPFIPELH